MSVVFACAWRAFLPSSAKNVLSGAAGVLHADSFGQKIRSRRGRRACMRPVREGIFVSLFVSCGSAAALPNREESAPSRSEALSINATAFCRFESITVSVSLKCASSMTTACNSASCLRPKPCV